jgi:hypothetical protein
MNQSTHFTTDITLLDNHIDTVMEYCEADYTQVSLVALGMFGFVLSHAGMKQTSLMVLDFSISGSGKSHNIDLQYKALLRPIAHEQTTLQVSANEGEEKIKRYMNIHRNKVTVPALYECFKTVRAQMILTHELGLSLRSNDEIIQTITELYGIEETVLPALKTEAPSMNSTILVALNFIGATTLDYFGSKEKLKHHLLGGFVNRALLVFNNRMKSSDEIKAIGLSEMNTSTMNEKISALLAFLRANSLEVSFCSDSEELLTQFSRDIQKLKIEFYQEGNESFGGFYNRVVQNTLMITRIFHALKCFENGHWDETINPLTTESAITYMKLVVYPQIDRLIDYLIDKTKLAQEEKQLKRIRTVVEKYLAEHGTMPTTRHVTQYSLVSQKNILRLTRGYLELQPGTTILRYCADAK